MSDAASHSAPPSIALEQSRAATGWTDEGVASAPVAHSSSSGDASTAELLHFRLLLRQNEKEMQQTLQDVSDPTSAKYGQHLSAEQLRELASPPLEEQQRVEAWLRKALAPLPGGDADVHSTGDAIVVERASLEAVQRAFGCQIHRFREQQPPAGAHAVLAPSGAAPFVPRSVLRCVGTVHIPKELEGIVTGSSGLVDLPMRLIGGPHPHQQQQQLHPSGVQVQTQAVSAADSQAAPYLAHDQRENPVASQQGVPLPHFTLRSTTQLNQIGADFAKAQAERKH